MILPEYFTLKVAFENKSSFSPNKKLQINSVITIGNHKKENEHDKEII